jgi:hypothetical protein
MASMILTPKHAIDAAMKAEVAIAHLGIHAAAGGSCITKGGSEKDADVILYLHDPSVEPPCAGLIGQALCDAGFGETYFREKSRYINRRVAKTNGLGYRVDFLLTF